MYEMIILTLSGEKCGSCLVRDWQINPFPHSFEGSLWLTSAQINKVKKFGGEKLFCEDTKKSTVIDLLKN